MFIGKYLYLWIMSKKVDRKLKVLKPLVLSLLKNKDFDEEQLGRFNTVLNDFYSGKEMWIIFHGDPYGSSRIMFNKSPKSQKKIRIAL